MVNDRGGKGGREVVMILLHFRRVIALSLLHCTVLY